MNKLSNIFWSDIVYSAKRRKIDFNITKEYAWNIFLEQKEKCVLSNVFLKLDPYYSKKNGYNRNNHTASLDRIDSKYGYIEKNVQWLHKDINNLKARKTNEEVIEISRIIFLEDLKKRRPCWNEYFMEMAYIISTRSRDLSTKCGCVITDENHKIISCGYNGYLQDINDDVIPKTRPDKYPYTIHAEQNAILFAYRSLLGCKAYITSIPCSVCCNLLLQSGVDTIYYGKSTANMCDLEEQAIVKNLCKLKNAKLIELNI